MIVLETLFWISLALIIYTYVLFPALVLARCRFFPRPYRKARIHPRVSMVMAVHNEEKDLPAKLENIRSLDYPGTFEVIIASDGSTDKTNEILQRSLASGIIPLLLPRGGKARALNAAVEHSQGDILVFSDANSIYAPDAIQKLVEPFADPTVGGVAGNQRYYKEMSANISQAGEKKYWDFDRVMKDHESRAGNVISATGAIYAIRRNLFQPIIDGVTDDFYTSTAVIEQGYRLVFAPDAVSYEPVSADANREFKRKVRIITRGLRAVIARRRLLNPFKYGFYALQLFSHKVLRRLVVFPLLALFLTSIVLASQGWLYAIAAAGQAAFYGAAVVGFVIRSRRSRLAKLTAIPFYFSLVNIAALLAAKNIVLGETISRWEPQRVSTQPGARVEKG